MYNVSGDNLRNIAEGLAQLAAHDRELRYNRNQDERYEIALRVTNEAMPFYRTHMPEELQAEIQQVVNPSELEKTCLEIIRVHDEQRDAKSQYIPSNRDSYRTVRDGRATAPSQVDSVPKWLRWIFRLQ